MTFGDQTWVRAPDSDGYLFCLDVGDGVILIDPLSLLSVKGFNRSLVDGVGQERQRNSFGYIWSHVHANQKRERESVGNNTAERLPTNKICLVNPIINVLSPICYILQTIIILS